MKGQGKRPVDSSSRSQASELQAPPHSPGARRLARGRGSDRGHVQHTMPWLMLVAGVLVTTCFAGQSSVSAPPPPWPVELGEAFELYEADEFLEVQRVCQRLQAGTRDARVRREAGALQAMATMRLPGRANWLTGRAQLAQLAKEDPSLLTRPECQLAYGIAQTALSETASALHHLNQAAQTFERRGQARRLGETCVALAEAWARHGEWELPVPDLDIPRPDGRAAADRIRRVQIRALRERVSALPDGQAYAARIELILARHLVASEDGAREGVLLLEELAASRELTKTTAQACLALAERYEGQQRWVDAARLYARMRDANLGKLSRLAEKHANAIERPQLDLDVPVRVGSGEVAVKVRARNVDRVEFEVRRVDLAPWLAQRQGRYAEAALPTYGALIAVRELDTTVSRKHDWWCSDELDEPPTFPAPTGAVAVLAHALKPDGTTITIKRLVIGGEVQATVFIGSRHAVVWTTRGREPVITTGDDELQARFWMHGSFVPVRPEFSEGVARFALPPEARLLRDKRWVCLVQAGEQVALCHGRLPAAAGEKQPAPTVALIGGPPAPHTGEELHVFGLLLGALNRPPANRAPLEVELLDGSERVRDTVNVSASLAGTFAARLPITNDMEGEHLRVAVRMGEQVLKNVYRGARAHVTRADQPPLRVRCNLPGWTRVAGTSLVGQIEASYAWGTPAAQARARARARAVRLPTVEPKRKAVYLDALSRRLSLDAEGKGDYAWALSDFNLPEGPLAVGVWASASGWDGREGHAFAQTLLSSQPAHLWLRCDTETLRVGQPLSVFVGWFDPTGRATGLRPTLAVWRSDTHVADPQLLPAINGLRSESWRPMQSGSYELVATLPLGNDAPLIVRETIHVEGHTTTEQQDGPGLQCEAHLEQQADGPCVRARLTGPCQEPLLGLVEAGDLLAAKTLPGLPEAAEVLLPLSQYRADARLLLAASGPDGVQIVGSTVVRPADEQALTLSLSEVANEITPGATIRVSATCRRGKDPARDAVLAARLADISESGTVQWLPGEAREDVALLPDGIQVTSSAGLSAGMTTPGGELIAETRELPAGLARALFEGPTLWVDSRGSRDGVTTFQIPGRPARGLYRLVVTAYTAEGGFAVSTRDLDTRRSFELAVDVPETLMVGDRSIASLVITNDRSSALRARVGFNGGPGLHGDELRALDPRDAAASAGESLAVCVAPFGTAVVRANVEAVQAGVGTAVFTVETHRKATRQRGSEATRQRGSMGLRPVRCEGNKATRQPGNDDLFRPFERRAAASYEVLADSTVPVEAAGQQPLAIHRTLFLLEEEKIGGAEPSAEAPERPSEWHRSMAGGLIGQTNWLRFELKPGERLTPGQLVLVQEKFTLNQPRERVEWRQRLPGNCYTHAGEASDLHQLGTQSDLRLGALTHSTSRLKAGRHNHEYVIVPVRPGACRFPPADVRANGQPVPIQVESQMDAVLVAERQ